MSRNKLTPQGAGGRLMNFIINFFWALVWLGRSIIRFIKKRFVS